VQNYEKDARYYQSQLEEMRSGRITDLEMSQTKAMIRNLLLEIEDSAFEMIAYDFNRQFSGKDRSREELLQQVEDIQVADVQAAASTFDLDTIYFLKGQKEE
ncbi:peptidase M16, partial [Paenibacillus sp. AR247]